MPAITKDRAIEILREALQNVQNVADTSEGIAGWHRNGDVAGWHEVLPEVGGALAATEHITEAAATQAVDLEPVMYQNRLVGPNGHRGSWVECEVSTYERFAESPDVGDGFKYEVRALFVAQPVPRAGRNAQPDSSPDLAPTDLSAVEVPPLPRAAMLTGKNLDSLSVHYSADQMTNFYREGYAAGRASMKGNKQ